MHIRKHTYIYSITLTHSRINIRLQAHTHTHANKHAGVLGMRKVRGVRVKWVERARKVEG